MQNCKVLGKILLSRGFGSENLFSIAQNHSQGIILFFFGRPLFWPTNTALSSFKTRYQRRNSLKTLTSLNKEVSLNDYSICRSWGIFWPCDHGIRSIWVHCPQILASLRKMEIKESRLQFKEVTLFKVFAGRKRGLGHIFVFYWGGVVYDVIQAREWPKQLEKFCWLRFSQGRGAFLNKTQRGIKTDGFQNGDLFFLTRHFATRLFWYLFGCLFSSTQRGIKADGHQNGKFFECWKLDIGAHYEVGGAPPSSNA